MTNIVPMRRRDSVTSPATAPLALPVLVRLPRIEFDDLRVAPTESGRTGTVTEQAFIAGQDYASLAHAPLSNATSVQAEQSPAYGYVEPSSTATSSHSMNTVPEESSPASTYRLDGAHQTASQSSRFDSGSEPVDERRPAPADENSQRSRTSGHTLWPRHRMLQKAAVTSATILLVLTPLYFLLVRSTPEVSPEANAWPDETLQAGTKEENPQLNHPRSGQPQTPRMADRPNARPFAPRFPRIPDSQRGAGASDPTSRGAGVNDAVPKSDQSPVGEQPSEAKRFAERPSREAPKAPQVRLGRNIESVPGGDDEWNRQSIY